MWPGDRELRGRLLLLLCWVITRLDSTQLIQGCHPAVFGISADRWQVVRQHEGVLRFAGLPNQLRHWLRWEQEAEWRGYGIDREAEGRERAIWWRRCL
jgi:hypothetical protein